MSQQSAPGKGGNHHPNKKELLVLGLGMGTAIGMGIGLSLDSIAVGTGIGLAMGYPLSLAMEYFQKRAENRSKKAD